MSTNGGQEDHGVFGVAQRTSCGEIVSRRAGGCRHADTVGLHGGEMLVVAEDLNSGHRCGM